MKLAYFDDYRLGVVTAVELLTSETKCVTFPGGTRGPDAALIENFTEYRARLERASISGRPYPCRGQASHAVAEAARDRLYGR